jgi:hypothetical protein
MIENSIAQDWPNLARFQKENATLESREKDDKRIVFMGNSITELWSITSPDFFSN